MTHAWILLLAGWWILPGPASPAAPSENTAAPAPSPPPATAASENPTAAPSPTAGTLASRLLERSLSLWEVVDRSRDQQRRYGESQAVLQEERLEWLAERDRITVTIGGMNRQIARRDRRLRELVEALYKLTHATYGQAHVRAGRRTVPRDGRIVVLALLERELAEKRALQADLRDLHARREAVDRTVGELAALEESFRLLALEAGTLIQRSLFEVAPVDARLEKFDRANYDARDWARDQRIRTLRALHRKPDSGLVRYRGLLVRPVAGPVLPDPPGERPGVYLSGVPGDPVRAPEAGTVRFVGPLEGFGTVIVIEHEFSLHSIVGRVDAPAVKPGDVVRRAQFLARVPAGPGSSQPVYLELRQGRESVDPRLWLKKNE